MHRILIRHFYQFDLLMSEVILLLNSKLSTVSLLQIKTKQTCQNTNPSELVARLE